MKVSYKKIRSNINWSRKTSLGCFGQSLTDFLEPEIFDQQHILSIIVRGKNKRSLLEVR